MKVYTRPPKVTLRFADHMTESRHWFDLKDVTDFAPAEVEVTGWLLAENQGAYLVSTARVTNAKGGETEYGDTWTILKSTVREKMRHAQG